jgi:hypothetical protein
MRSLALRNPNDIKNRKVKKEQSGGDELSPTDNRTLVPKREGFDRPEAIQTDRAGRAGSYRLVAPLSSLVSLLKP